MRSEPSQNPKVSVCVITYNQEAYIKTCLKSILSQQTNFDFDIVIGEDCSKDNTATIISECTKNHSHIKLLDNTSNLGVLPNFIRTLEATTGKYIAFCEGDDYWVDENKLQKQVDFLEQNSEYRYCGHQSQVLDNAILTPMYIKTGVLVLEDVIVQNILNTASLVIRQPIINELPSLFENAKAGDWMLQLIALKSGNAYIMEDVMSVYRKHDTSVWSSLSSKEKGQLGIDNMRLAKSFFAEDKGIRKLIDKAIKLRQKKFGLEPGSILKRIKRKILK